MARRDKYQGREEASQSAVALFDKCGRLQGWTSEFANQWSPSGDDPSGRLVTDFLPHIDADRWARIWHDIDHGDVQRICSPLACTEDGNLDLIEVQICKLIAPEGRFAKVEVCKPDGASAQLRLLQQEIMEAMASGVALPQIMDLLCRRAESFAPSAVLSLLIVDGQGRLQHLASPSLPEDYCEAVNGIQIGPDVGSCGSAAYLGVPVEATDIATDPKWTDYKHLVLPLGLRACWSSPIKSSKGTVLGVIGFYFPTVRRPTSMERQIVATCGHLCAIALEHEQTRQRIYELAFQDPLTRLSNRIRFQQRVGEALGVMGSTDRQLAIHYVGLDHFRSINDALGHANGDDVLRMAATRLQQIVRDGELVGRIGGDEFAVLQIGAVKVQDIADRARAIIDSIERPYDLRGQQLALGASVGIAVAPADGANADELMKNAALALRRGKELGRGTYVFYEKKLNARMQERRRIETGLRNALTSGEFELYFQPVIDLETLQITKAEALLRWHHGEREGVAPSEFIPVAEDTGLIVPIGAWALEQACIAAASWPKHVSVAVNLSPVQFERPGLVEAVASAFANFGLEPSRLELEITESALLKDNAVGLLDRLRNLGATIALDDFGTGYASLRYLQQFPFNRIKIDQSFIAGIDRNIGSLKIVRSIVMLAHNLGLKVTAEGIETDKQFAAVRGEGCDDVQGYYFGVPQPLDAFTQLLTIAPSWRRSIGIAS